MKVRSLVAATFRMGVLAFMSGVALAAPAQPEFTVLISLFPTWMSGYGGDSLGLFKKYGDEAGITIKVAPGKYGDTLDAYVAGKGDAVFITSMDTLIGPVVNGIESTALYLTDISNGADAVLVKKGFSWSNIKGKKLLIVPGTISELVLASGLKANGLTIRDVVLVPTDEAEIPAKFDDPSIAGAVTWNPNVMAIEQKPGVVRLFDSSKIPGLVLDLMLVRTDKLKANPKLGIVLTKVWYEMASRMRTRGPKGDETINVLAKLSETPPAEYRAQLASLAPFWTPEEANRYVSSADLKKSTKEIRDFCFAQGWMKELKPDSFGIQYPDGEVLGNKDKILFHFVTTPVAAK